MAAVIEPRHEHADWLAAYDAYVPDVRPRPKPPEPDLGIRCDGSFVEVLYERCAECKQLDKVGEGGVLPYYVKGVGPGVPGNRKVVIRWLHREPCRDEWRAKYAEWLKEQKNAEHK